MSLSRAWGKRWSRRWYIYPCWCHQGFVASKSSVALAAYTATAILCAMTKLSTIVGAGNHGTCSARPAWGTLALSTYTFAVVDTCIRAFGNAIRDIKACQSVVEVAIKRDQKLNGEKARIFYKEKRWEWDSESGWKYEHELAQMQAEDGKIRFVTTLQAEVNEGKYTLQMNHKFDFSPPDCWKRPKARAV